MAKHKVGAITVVKPHWHIVRDIAFNEGVITEKPTTKKRWKRFLCKLPKEKKEIIRRGLDATYKRKRVLVPVEHRVYRQNYVGDRVPINRTCIVNQIPSVPKHVRKAMFGA